MAHEEGNVIDRARSAVARGAWPDALELLRERRADGPLAPSELSLLAQASYGAGEFEAAISAWEEAHRALNESGEAVAAAEAAVNVALYLLIDTGLMAPVRGWLRRTERLLEGHEECPVHAWSAMVRAYERLLSGDLAQADHWAGEAIAVGARQAVAAPAAIGQLARARIRILEGDVSAGMALLDEAAAVTLSGELDALSVGMVHCELVCAVQGLAQYDYAEQWTDAMERWGQAHAYGSMVGRCRVHRAEILRLRGAYEQAESEALRACEELRPWMRREFGWPLSELGVIRLRRGDLAGAESALLSAHRHGWNPHPGLALLRLAQGDVAEAASLIRDALEHPRQVASKERPPYGGLWRAPLLDAQVEIAVAAGAVAVAERAAGELAEIAAVYRSRALIAAAALARGRVALAQDDADAAVSACDEAVGAWSEIGAPYEASVARTVLAEAHRAQGSDDLAALEPRAARATFERLRAGLETREPARASGQGAPVHRPTESLPHGLFRCEGDTRRIEFAGRRVMLKDLKGMRYLARLLAEPGREFHVLDLVAAERATPLPAGPARLEGELVSAFDEGAGPLLDEAAVQAYKRRLADVDEDLDEAERLGDAERAAQARVERDYLVDELSRAFGLGGRHRSTGSHSERARASVTRSVRYAVERIREHHDTLALHLQHTVSTGTYCSYTPDPTAPIDWQV